MCTEKVIHRQHSSADAAISIQAETFFGPMFKRLFVWKFITLALAKLLHSSKGTLKSAKPAKCLLFSLAQSVLFQSSSEYKQIHLIPWMAKKNCTFFRHCIFLLLFLCHHKPCGVDSTMWTIGNEWSKIFDCEIRYDCLRWKRECKLDDRTNCGRFPTSVDSLVRNPKGWTIRASTVFELVATDFIIVRGSSELRNSSIQKKMRQTFLLQFA